MCEYNACITSASVAINYRAFDLVYTVNLALSQNILRHLATELLYPPPDQRASIYHAGPAGSRGSAVGRIYNTMHASWSSPACLWKTKQTGLNSKFPVGASSKSCFLKHISCGIQCMRERIKNIQTIRPQKTPQWRKQKGQCNLYVCALYPNISILPLCISHPSIWPPMRTQHEAAHAGWMQHWISGNSLIRPFVMSSWPCMHMPSKHQPSSMPNHVLSIHLKIHHSTLLVSDLAVELNAKEIGKAMYTPNVRGTELWISYSI